jgi:hypothetical protein
VRRAVALGASVKCQRPKTPTTAQGGAGARRVERRGQVDAALDLRHAVVRDHKKRRRRPALPTVQKIEERPQRFVLLAQSAPRRFGIRAVAMTGTVGAPKPRSDERGPLRGGSLEPLDDLRDLSLLRNAPVEFAPLLGTPSAAPGTLRSHPVVGGAAQTRSGQNRPQRFDLEPARVVLVAVGTALRVAEAVVDDSVARGPDTRHQGDVVGKGVGRKNRAQRRRGEAARGDTSERGQRFHLGRARAVEGDQHDSGRVRRHVVGASGRRNEKRENETRRF